MPEKRTVKVNGEEFEVEIELNDDGTYNATVEGQTFSIEVPNAQAAPRARRGGGGKKKKSELSLQTFQVKLSPSKSRKAMLSKRVKSFLSLRP